LESDTSHFNLTLFAGKKYSQTGSILHFTDLSGITQVQYFIFTDICVALPNLPANK
jgi:hypothetical protein